MPKINPLAAAVANSAYAMQRKQAQTLKKLQALSLFVSVLTINKPNLAT